MDNKIVNFPFFQAHHHHHQNTVLLKDDQNPTVENSSFPLPPPASDILDSFFTTTKMDPPGIGFLDDVGGSVDGLMSCTESLGFESSDERRVDDLIENLDEMEEYCLKKPSKNFNSKSKLDEKRKIKIFPPPLSSMSQDGKPKSFLQPMRIDGRLKLTEIRLFQAPEILRASREDGRLRLHLIQDDDENEDEKNEEMDNGENDNGVNMQLEALDDVADIDDDDEWLEERAESRLLSESDDDDGLIKRCYDGKGKPLLISLLHHRRHHHHGLHQHDIHVWRQQLMC